MAKKKPARKKKTAGAKKLAAKKRHPVTKTLVAKKKPIGRKKTRGAAEQQITYPVALRGPSASALGGQAGDTQGLSRREGYGSESVEELVEEGQYFEAEAASGVEDAKDPDQSEVTTSEVPEDDVPSEYTDRDDQT